MSWSVHIDSKNKVILILGEGSTQELDDTAITAEVKYPIIFTQPKEKLLQQILMKRKQSIKRELSKF